MDLTDIPIFAMLKGKLAYTSARQEVIARNVANADTPGYAPHDLKAFSFDQMLRSGGQGSGLAVARTNASHLSLGAPKAAGWDAAEDATDSEVRLDGNHVVLEEQMMKLTEARTDYDAAIGLYQKSLQMLRTAIKRPGQ